MAADGQSTAHEQTIVSTTSKKLRRFADGRIVGVAGDTAQKADFLRFLETGKKYVQADGFSSVALVLHPDGRIMLHVDQHNPSEVDAPAAIGSGEDFAVGAMLAGMTARQAVEVACARDVYSGGVVTLMSFLTVS